MKRWVQLFGLSLFFCLAICSPCWAEVIMSDEDYQELVMIMDQLETLTIRQQTTIETLQNENKELKQQSIDKQQILNEQQELETKRETLYKKEKRSWINTLISSILVGIMAFFAGVSL